MGTRVNSFPRQVGLYIQESKAEVIYVNSHPGAESPQFEGDFTYLSSSLSEDNRE